jgi:hypothetical protein
MTKTIPAFRYLADFARIDGVTRQAMLYRSRRGLFVPIVVANGYSKSQTNNGEVKPMTVWASRESVLSAAKSLTA